MEKMLLRDSICKTCGHDITLDATPFKFDMDLGVASCERCPVITPEKQPKAAPLLNNAEKALLVGFILGAVSLPLIRLIGSLI